MPSVAEIEELTRRLNELRDRMHPDVVRWIRRAHDLAAERHHDRVTVHHLILTVAEDPTKWGISWDVQWRPPDEWVKAAQDELERLTAEPGKRPYPDPEWANVLLRGVEGRNEITLRDLLITLVTGVPWCHERLLTSAAVAINDPTWSQDQEDLRKRGVAFGNNFVNLGNLVGNPALRPGPERLEGRDGVLKELQRRLEAGSIMIVGPSGAGKTTLVRQLAIDQLRAGRPPIREIVLSQLWTSWFEGANQLLTKVTEWARQRGYILFCDEFDSLLSIGASASKPTGLLLDLVPEIDRGLRVIGALTDAGLDRLRRDDAVQPLLRRMGQLRVTPLATDDTRAVLKAALLQLGAAIDDQLFERFLTVCDWLLLRETQPAKGLRWIRAAAALAGQKREVTETELSKVIAGDTGMPQYVLATYLRGDVSALGLADVDGLREYLRERVQAQDRAIDEVVRIVEGRLSISQRVVSSNRPRAVFLFLGSPGTGKTSLARYLGEYLFEELPRAKGEQPGAGGALVYTMAGQSVRVLLGTRGAGGERGRLAMDMADRAARVVVFDDFERASDMHVHDLLLPILSEGCVRSARDEQIYFTDTIVVLTSNLSVEDRAAIGLPAGNDRQDEQDRLERDFLLKRRFVERYGRAFEALLDRVDGLIVFRDFSQQDLLAMARAKQALYNKRLKDTLGYTVEMSDEVLLHVAQRAFRARAGSGGARELERTLADEVYDGARREVRQTRTTQRGHDWRAGYWLVRVTLEGDKLVFNATWQAQKGEEPCESNGRPQLN